MYTQYVNLEPFIECVRLSYVRLNPAVTTYFQSTSLCKNKQFKTY